MPRHAYSLRKTAIRHPTVLGLPGAKAAPAAPVVPAAALAANVVVPVDLAVSAR